jgi:hypothetical protein
MGSCNITNCSNKCLANLHLAGPDLQSLAMLKLFKPLRYTVREGD